MSSTRRLFLQSAAFSMIAANLSRFAFAQKLLNRRPGDFDSESLAIFNGVSRQTFEPWIGGRFSVSLNNKSLGSLVLLSVDDIDTTQEEVSDSTSAVFTAGRALRSFNQPAINSFALRFQRMGNALPQDTYMLAHDWLGTFPLLLVPSGLSGPVSTCTAVFTFLNSSGIKSRDTLPAIARPGTIGLSTSELDGLRLPTDQP